MLSERLKKLRKKRKITQKQIAEELNISQQAYQAWESGKRKAGQETLLMFSSYFNVSIDYLLGKEKIKNDEDTVIKDLEPTSEREKLLLKFLKLDYLSIQSLKTEQLRQILAIIENKEV